MALIVETLQRGEKVTLTPFGTFELRRHQARQGVNSQTRQPLSIPANTVSGLSASAPLRAAVHSADARAPSHTEA